jgi:micrococcal nuclease
VILVKLKLSKKVFVITIAVVLAGVIGYFIPHKSTVKEVPVLYVVAEVIDGDTIRVEMNNKAETVRLLGINTPEVSNPYKPEECFGKEASEKVKELLTNKEVYLIPDLQSPDRDKYDRLLRYVFLPDGKFINADLIKEGYAFNYIYEPFQFMKQFDYLEKQAKENRLGLWSNKCNYYFEIENQ